MKDFFSEPRSSVPDFSRHIPPIQEAAVEDEVIWERFKKGNKAALTYIYRNYANPLYNYGCQITSNRELVKDAVQDLFIEIINSRKRLGKTTSIKYYLLRSLRNKLIKVLAKQSKNQNIGTDHSFQISISPELTLINRQVDEEKQQLLTQKLNLLPPLQREALLLFYFEGMKYEQIAGILGMKVKSARALVYRAINSLSKLLLPIKDKIV